MMPDGSVDAWWVAVWVYAALLLGQRLWRAGPGCRRRTPRPTTAGRSPTCSGCRSSVLDVVFGVPLVFAVVIAWFAI